jgi:hypothetical protein
MLLFFDLIVNWIYEFSYTGCQTTFWHTDNEILLNDGERSIGFIITNVVHFFQYEIPRAKKCSGVGKECCQKPYKLLLC